MLKKVDSAKSKCIWIGPPDLRYIKGVTSYLNEGIQQIKSMVEKNKCAFIDSKKLTTYPPKLKGGIHYDKKSGTLWGQKVNVEISKEIEKMKAASDFSRKGGGTPEGSSSSTAGQGDGIR
jgi:hypothetical protein